MHVHELVLGEAGVRQRPKSLFEMFGVPKRPLGIGAVGLDLGLVMSLRDFVEENFQLREEIALGHHAFGSSFPTPPNNRAVGHNLYIVAMGPSARMRCMLLETS